MKKKQLNEEINRIKSMMKSINENEFESNGNIPMKKHRSTNCSAEIEIPYNDDYLYPIFDGDCTCESGAFDYEYGGVSGTHDPGMECYVDDIDWNRGDFSSEENEFIQKYLDENGESIDIKLSDDYMENMKHRDPF